MLVVAGFFWVDPARQRSYQFTPEHVRIWKNMISRNLTVPHRIVCITHLPGLFDGIVETVPLDDRKHVPGTCFTKLMLWRPDIGAVLGDRILYLDLDVVVTGTLDVLVDGSDDVVFFRNPNYPKPRRSYFQTSIILLTAGARPQLWDDFDPNTTPSWVNRRFGGAEQAWIAERLNTEYPVAGDTWTEAVWTEEDGIRGAMRLGDVAEGVRGELPPNTRLVVFPGNRMPDQPEMRAQFPWLEEHYW